MTARIPALSRPGWTACVTLTTAAANEAAARERTRPGGVPAASVSLGRWVRVFATNARAYATGGKSVRIAGIPVLGARRDQIVRAMTTDARTPDSHSPGAPKTGPCVRRQGKKTAVQMRPWDSSANARHTLTRGGAR